MLYKTIVLELIREWPRFYEELRTSKRLLTSVETYASDLREGHLVWKATLAMRRPAYDPSLIASEALELAIADLLQRLRCASARPEAS